MATLQLSGKITEIRPVEYVGANKLAKQTIIFFVPGYHNEFGEKVGIDEEWEIAAMGDKIAPLALAPDKLNKKVKIKFFVNSRRVEAKEAGKPDMFITNNTIHSYEIIP